MTFKALRKTSRRWPCADDRAKRVRRKAFLAAYRTCGTLYHASVASGVSVSQHYVWLQNDPEYTEQFERAREEAGELLEREARRRALEGVLRFKFHNGKPVVDPRTGQPYCELEYSDLLMIFLLKGVFPEKYRERQAIEVKNTTPLRTFGEERLQQLRQALAALQDGREAMGLGQMEIPAITVEHHDP